MERSSATLLCTALATLLLTSACTPKTSVERHARQYVYAADDGFDPNFNVNKADSARMMVPFFRQFRETGEKDRTAGVSQEEAQKKAAEFRSEKFLTSIRGKTTFAGREYDDSQIPSPKKLKALGDAIAETYLDGYEGRQ
ncbi:Exc2 family lipoprotein [Salmonella enterica subsp. enterica serovar 1,4,[5],12:i:-]|uniref:Exc2 family lipoprotein n=1 Tax=Klebsiella pneumoniae TaxID=573 RepID=UPI00107B9650|nr:Exc2 family lipoprotein [Klebsiella pneumoniae]EAA7344326.1 entry exclusion protein 2 [Salmonella enterica]EBP0126066.1 Exc2 family lipoprotein [Salmonella enterica]EFD5185067.1 Exc2 family lipoprotein [Escherichia coli]